ncbi:hypothetical protein GCM10009730_59220 [Streptomyces albidochromogenes]|uniref:hypothetical protein n=1 Tax=Streptomyces albidochromogenes TaxID=329524 RepID=UPI001FCA9C2D|nr:hypothetical protein [Streptomyces albidochromogenes]
MTHTPRPLVEAILAVLPELAPHARDAVIFHPERAEPDCRTSSIGGPLLWPSDEPWPECSLPDVNSPDGAPATAMVPVAQIFCRDAPGPWWPAGTDLLQILWCPNEHWDPPVQQADISPVLEVRWRQVADVINELTTPPPPSRYEEDGYLPQACGITAERVTDFPFREELPAELLLRLEDLVRQTGGGGDAITRLAGWELGGWPTWHLTHPTVFACGDCGTAMTLLFTVASETRQGSSSAGGETCASSPAPPITVTPSR